MKLIIQIPCLNEEATLPATIADLPRQIDGIDEVELLVDRRRLDRPHGRGRPRARRRAHRPPDQQQGPGGGVPGRARRLPQARRRRRRQHRRRQPVQRRRRRRSWSRRSSPARPTWSSATARSPRSTTSPARRRRCSGSAAGSCGGSPGPRSPTPPPASAPTTARRRCSLLVVDNFTYTLESLIQAGKMLVAVDQVEIATNPQTRESRLFDSTGAYVRRNALSILRIYARYEPLRVFASAGARRRAARAGRLDAVPDRLDLQRRQQRPRPVADPRRRPLHRRRAAARAGRDRRPAGRPAGDDAAGLRAGAAGRAGARASSPPTTSAARDADAADGRRRRGGGVGDSPTTARPRASSRSASASPALITYVYFLIASHVLSKPDYGQITVLWSAVFITDLDPLPAGRTAALAPHLRTAGEGRADRASRCGSRRRSSSASRSSSRSSRWPCAGRSRTACWKATKPSTGSSSGAVLFYAASYFARGFLAGQRRFGPFTALILSESVFRTSLRGAGRGRPAQRPVGGGDRHRRRALALACWSCRWPSPAAGAGSAQADRPSQLPGREAGRRRRRDAASSRCATAAASPPRCW